MGFGNIFELVEHIIKTFKTIGQKESSDKEIVKRLDLSKIIRLSACNYITLINLSLINCALSEFPFAITELYLLEYLNLDGNHISNIPPKYDQLMKRSKRFQGPPGPVQSIIDIINKNSTLDYFTDIQFGSQVHWSRTEDGDFRIPVRTIQLVLPIIIEPRSSLGSRRSCESFLIFRAG